MSELPHTIRLLEVIEEADGIKSLIFPRPFDAKPGQFVMLWLPGNDSKPVGVSYLRDSQLGVTVSAVGPWSQKVCALRPGGYLGVFGPYGNGFKLQGQSIALVGGGYGTASLMLLAEESLRRRCEMTLIVGARSASRLLYRERVKRLGVSAVFTTDDGSFGERGSNLEALAKLVGKRKVDAVYGCGPELMEKSLCEFCVERSIPCYVSLERHMKCGYGVCGACCLDPTGQRVCVEGPVFEAREALSFSEFGRYHRDSSAAKHYFKA